MSKIIKETFKNHLYFFKHLTLAFSKKVGINGNDIFRISFRLLSFVLFLFFFNTNAQISIGAKLGLTSNNTTNDTRNISFSESRSKIDFYGGLAANFQLNSFLELRSELNYSKKGYQVLKYLNQQNQTNKSEANSSTWGINYTYLQLPVLLHYKLIDSDKIKLYLGGGPYLSYALAAQKWAKLSINNLGNDEYTFKSLSEKYEFDTETKNDNRTDNRLDFGLIANVGIAFKFRKGDFFIETRYEHGTIDWHKFDGEIPKTYSSTLNRSYTFVAGFMFQIKEKSKETTIDSD